MLVNKRAHANRMKEMEVGLLDKQDELQTAKQSKTDQKSSALVKTAELEQVRVASSLHSHA